MKYCTYIIISNIPCLPPFYIGSTTIKNIHNGYLGSVSSHRYKKVWKYYTKNFPDKFKLIILTTHKTRKGALEKEDFFLRKLDCPNNPLYVNLSYTNGYSFDTIRPPVKDHTRNLISLTHKGKPKSEEHKKKISDSHKGKKCPWNEKTNKKRIGEKRTKEQKEKMSISLKLSYERGRSRRKLTDDDKRKMQEGIKNSNTYNKGSSKSIIFRGKVYPSKKAACEDIFPQHKNATARYHLSKEGFEYIC